VALAAVLSLSAGAASADSGGDKGGRHWAYSAPERPALPEVRDASWVRNPIDRFVLARLEAEGMEPSPTAEKGKLIRRLYLDLIGLPPSPAEIDRFIRDESPNAYERLVDRLLNSSRFGEKWARQWLDAARYADSNGYQADQLRSIWAYRDWVVEAINEDKPFDTFTIEQLAGDLLPNATKRQRIATGFHRTTACNVEAGVDPEENRVNQVFDRVNTTGTVWLGTTIECSQCHDHKYDPFSQKEYYELFAFFNNTPIEVEHGGGTRYDFYGPKMELPLREDQRQRRERLTERRDKLDQKIAARRKAVRERRDAWERRAREQLEQDPAWRTLQVVSFESSGGASHRVLEDGSVLLEGKKPDKDAYTVVARADGEPVRGLRLDALTHEALPGKGPGRHNESNPNFVLHELSVAAAPEGADPSAVDPEAAERVGLHAPRADYEQSNFPVKELIDGVTDERRNGWAIHPKFHEPHHATFSLTEPIEGETLLVFELPQNYGGGRTIGRLRLSVSAADPAISELPDAIAEILRTPAERRSDEQQQKLREHHESLDPKLAELRRKRDAVLKQLEEVEPPTTLVMTRKDEPRQTHVFNRGDYEDKGPEVEPDVPEILHGWPEGAPRNRLGFARWLVDEDNPLVARVTVNRWWAKLFGRGLVTTPEDFGARGQKPTHPKLLDWLAVEFMERGWSIKQMVRSIVMSRAYRLSTRRSESNAAIDPENVYLWRMNRKQLEAEAVRDAMLSASGRLDLTRPPRGSVLHELGPGVIGRNHNVGQILTGSNRRSVYLPIMRDKVPKMLRLFGFANPSMVVSDREEMTVPEQALFMMNSDFVREQSKHMADRLLGRSGPDEPGRIGMAYRLAFGRGPTDEERSRAQNYLSRMRDRFRDEDNGNNDTAARRKAWATLCQALFASAEFRYLLGGSEAAQQQVAKQEPR